MIVAADEYASLKGQVAALKTQLEDERRTKSAEVAEAKKVAKLEAELAAKDQIKKAYDEGFKMAKDFFKEMNSMKQN